MNSKIKLNILFGACALASVFTGCQDYDAGFTTKEISRAVFDKDYTANFIAEYGDISQVKSWDLSSLGDELNYMGGAQTRANSGEFSDKLPDGSTYSFHPLVGDALGNTSDIAETSKITTGLYDSQKDKDYYYLPEATFDWLSVNMTENVEHTDGTKRNKKGADHVSIPGAGKNFVFQKPQGDFWMLPVYQGYAISCYDLHLVVNGTDYLVWTKGQGIEYLTKKYTCVGYIKYTKEDGSEGEYRRSRTTSTKSEFETFKVGGYYTNSFNILTDNVTPEADGTSYKHTVTFKINTKDIAKNEVINTSNTSLVGNSVTFSYPYYKVDEPVSKGSEWIDLANYTTNHDYCTLEESPYNAWDIRCKPIHFDASKFKGDFFFYLEITKGAWDTNESRITFNANIAGTKQRSDKGMMAAMVADVQPDIAAVTGAAGKVNAVMLGCEAANRASSDYDYNDVVFLLVSKADLPILETVERRYLCEDLGSTYDFDFNDIVVDVKQTQLVTSTFTETDETTHEGTWTRTLSDKTQTVSIARMCGTIPFQVYVGSTNKEEAAFCFNPMRNPNYQEVDRKKVGYTPSNSEADVSTYCISKKVDAEENAGLSWWDPATNNIFIDVWQGGADPTDPNAAQGDSYVHTVKFPTYDPGEWDKATGKNEGNNTAGTKAPQMIAVDPTVMWMDENIHIPTAWIKIASDNTLDITNDTKDQSSTTTTEPSTTE